MKTSRFANVGDLGKHETPISISRWSPQWYFGKSYLTLAPPGEIVLAAKAGKLDQDDYEFLYKKNVLNRLDPNVVQQELLALGQNPVLLCYEDLSKPGEWCHRRMVAAWLEEHNTCQVPEWVHPVKVHSRLKF